jgi:hypothetical protein
VFLLNPTRNDKGQRFDSIVVNIEALADSQVVDVVWEGRTLAVFAAGLFKRGEETKSASV